VFNFANPEKDQPEGVRRRRDQLILNSLSILPQKSAEGAKDVRLSGWRVKSCAFLVGAGEWLIMLLFGQAAALGRSGEFSRNHSSIFLNVAQRCKQTVKFET